MDSKLTIELEIFRQIGENHLIQAIIKHQDEDLRGRRNMITIDDFILSSFIRPQITDKKLFIRGSERRYDNERALYYFTDYKQALDLVKKIEKVVEAIGGRVDVILN